MSAARRWFDDRFTHPRLAATFVAGLAVLLVGAGLATLAPDGGTRSLGGRVLVVGYLLALLGGSGYLAFAAFEFRDRALR